MNPICQSSESLLAYFTHALRMSGYQVSKEALSSLVADDEKSCLKSWVRACQELDCDVSIEDAASVEYLVLARERRQRVLIVNETSLGEETISDETAGKGESDFSLSLIQPDLNSHEGWELVVLEGERSAIKPILLQDIVLGSCIVLIGENKGRTEHEGEGSFLKRNVSAWLNEEFRRLWPVYRDVLLASVLINLFALASPFFVMNVYDRVVPNQAVETLWVLASGMFIIFVFDFIVKSLRYRFVESASRHLDIVLSSKLFSRVMNMSYEAYPASTGSLVSQLKDFELIKQFLAAATITALVDLPFVLLFMLVIFFVGGSIVAVPMVAGAILVLYGLFTQRILKSEMKEYGSASSEKTSVLVESLTVIDTVQSFNAQGRQKKNWELASVRMADAAASVKQKSGAVSIFSTAVMQLSIVAIVIAGVYQIETQVLSMGGLIACVLLGSRALAPMAQISNLLVQYHHAKSAREALDGVCDLPQDYDVNRKCVLLESQGALDVQFRQVSYAYDTGVNVLDGISINIESGEKVGIVGRIGSGKSTLIKQLLGLCENTTGAVFVGGVDLKHIDKKELRSRTGYVPQDIVLLNGSLKENICLGVDHVESERLHKIIDVCGLAELVELHPEGLNMRVGEGGKNLSGGQRQCVAIARALVKNPDLLLFDELTSAMDNQTEQMIIQGVQEELHNKTVILSTHRASLLRLVDRIIVMDQGKVIADGKKDVVLDALKKGLIKPHAVNQKSGQQSSASSEMEGD